LLVPPPHYTTHISKAPKKKNQRIKEKKHIKFGKGIKTPLVKRAKK
jgi:hypothetical protein